MPSSYLQIGVFLTDNWLEIKIDLRFIFFLCRISYASLYTFAMSNLAMILSDGRHALK